MPSTRLNDIEVQLPEGWADRSQLVAVGPAHDGLTVNFVATQEAANKGDDAKAYATRQLPRLKASLSDYALVKESAATYGGVPGILREHTFRAGAQKAGQLQFYAVRNGMAYVLSYTDAATRMNASRKIAEQLFASAKFGGGAAAGNGTATGTAAAAPAKSGASAAASTPAKKSAPSAPAKKK